MENYHPVSQRIKLLVDKYGDGSVRKFSRMVLLVQSISPTFIRIISDLLIKQ